MRGSSLMAVAVAVVSFGFACSAFAEAPASPAAAGDTKWDMNATIIEACSCPMFCQCYFNDHPGDASEHAGHAGHQHGAAAAAKPDAAGAEAGTSGHFCRFNNAYKVNHGRYGDTKLDGAKFWVAGDLGSDFSKGQMDWAVLTFDPATTPEQRKGITEILGNVYPVKWQGGFTVAPDAPVEWKTTNDGAVAKLNDGKNAEVVLKKFAGMSNEPVVIKNLKYWGVPRNDGFVLMPNEVEALRTGDKTFEFKGTNGFMITFDINSNDVKAANTPVKQASAAK